MNILSTILLSSLPFPFASGGDDAPGTWPQWRGPERDGQFSGPAWPDDVSEARLALSWTIPDLGPSYSGPIVSAQRVFTTETVDEESEVVHAFDRESGELLWSTSWAGAMTVPFFAAKNGSWIRSTPAHDGEALYVAGMRDVLVCLEAETGDVRWRVDFVERFESGLPSFGQVCSPLVDGDHVYVQAGDALVKLDKRTGETAWRSLSESITADDGAFSSPVLADLGGRRQLVVQSRSALFGVDPEDGSALWSTPVEAFRGMNILTPMTYGEAVFTSSYGGRAQLFAVQRADDGTFAAEKSWDNRAQGYMTSPVVVDGHAYLFLRSNRFACVDLDSGEERWISPPTGDSYWSLAARGDRILALSDTGVLRIVAADPAGYRVLSERQLVDGQAWAHVAPAGRQVFVRELNSLVALEWK